MYYYTAYLALPLAGQNMQSLVHQSWRAFVYIVIGVLLLGV